MKLKNTSVKVINIGTNALLPGAEMEVSAEVANLPSVRAIARMGLLTIEEGETEKAAAAKAKAKAEAEAKAAAAKEEAEAKAAAKAKTDATAKVKTKAEADKKADEQE